ncbi:MAG: FAD:protein FMN transferase [Elusimicrobia bacterium]|nr:FAD:protein FMN transferase [Elusimicrobiota bacterium]
MEQAVNTVVRFFLLFFSIAFIFGCCQKTQKKAFLYFGSFIEVTLPACNSSLFEDVEKIVKQTHFLLDISSGISAKLNKQGKIKNLELAELIKKTAEVSEITDGLYDITVEPILKIWGFSPVSKGKRIPSEKEIKKALKKVGWNKIKIEDDLIFTDNCEVNFGSCGKGFLEEKLKKFFAEKKVSFALVDAGGDVFCFGRKKWKIGIRDPFSKGIFGVIEVQDKSVATSGGYENYFEFKGKKYSHIFNPKTGYPVETDKIQVTVISQSPLFADIFATVFMLLDEEKIDEISQEFNLGYLIIYKNRKIQKNKFFPEIKPI